MDFGTIIGLVAVVGLILTGIMLGSPLIIFFDLTSMCIVGFGSIFILFAAYPAAEVKSMVSAVKKAFKQTPKKSEELLTLMRQMSTRARREGVLALAALVLALCVRGYSRSRRLAQDWWQRGATLPSLNHGHCMLDTETDCNREMAIVNSGCGGARLEG